MSIDTIYASVGKVFHKIREKAQGKERRVFLNFIYIFFNHPKKWVIRNEGGDYLTLNKKQCPSPAVLLKTRTTPVATVRGTKIIALNLENGLDLMKIPVNATKISRSKTTKFVEKEHAHSRN